MKTVRDFLVGKLRRAEVEDRLQLVLEGDADPELGALEAVLESPRGRLAFFAEGLRLERGDALLYRSLLRVEAARGSGDEATVTLRLEGGAQVILHLSPAGALVVHAALRWLGHTLLRRRIAD